jgi:hypothetical protein
MTSEEERILIEARITRLQMEHEDCLEMRNAVLLAMVFVPFAILAIPSQLNLLSGGNGLILIAVLVTAVYVYGRLEDKALEYGSRLKEIHASMDALIEQIELGLKKN